MDVSKALESIPGVMALAACAGAFASWFYMVGNGMRLWFHRKKPAPPPTSWWSDPAEVLTERGVVIYRHARYGLIGFFLCWLLGFLFSGLAQ
jgi:hypothetical protein